MSLFKDEQAHPLVLLRSYLTKFGGEALEWEPPVVRRSIEDETGTSLARINLIKLLAAMVIANRDSFWKEWETFHFLSQALNNNVPSLSTIQNQTVGQLMTAADIATSIREDLGDITNVPTFSEEVARYVAAQALEAGIWYLPEPLSFANKYTSGKMQRCRVCANVEEQQVDELCSFCTDRYSTESLLKFEPSESLVSQGHGKEVTLFEKHPSEPVRKRFEAALTKDLPLKETQVDICVARLLAGVRYMSHRREQLRSQAGTR